MTPCSRKRSEDDSQLRGWPDFYREKDVWRREEQQDLMRGSISLIRAIEDYLYQKKLHELLQKPNLKAEDWTC
ncbi:hypothetical protein Tco_0626807 [Tanacetum coccineum]|uniref:Uncharacterized protein n=1 Tax=Tanacetum coccineum TaxID=301880 RepID=A0ABQ4WKP3_9ASTR